MCNVFLLRTPQHTVATPRPSGTPRGRALPSRRRSSPGDCMSSTTGRSLGQLCLMTCQSVKSIDMFIIVMCLFIIDWNVRLTKTAGLCYSKRERKHNVETRTARIELSTKVNFLCNFLYKLVPGDRFSRQTERHSYPRNVPRRLLGGLGLQVAFVFLFNCSIEFTQSSNCRHLSCLQRWAWTPLAPLG